MSHILGRVHILQIKQIIMRHIFWMYWFDPSALDVNRI